MIQTQTPCPTLRPNFWHLQEQSVGMERRHASAVAPAINLLLVSVWCTITHQKGEHTGVIMSHTILHKSVAV